MGVTYEAERTADGMRVALKELRLSRVDDWKVLELFEREARVLANIAHPCVPAYIDHFKIESAEGAAFYLVQELAGGRSLAQRVADGFRADEAEAKRIAETLLDVLEYLHARNPPVFHRDIKPQNVLLDDAGKAWLVDFGSVRDVYKTTAGGSTVAGTFGYMAPEQLRGVARPESDLYGLGATLLFALSGQSPVDMPQVKLRVDFRRRVSLSKPMSAWLAKMLEPAPEDRFPSARMATLALRNPAAVAPRRRRTTAVLAGVLGLVVAGGAAFVAVTEWREAKRPRPESHVAGGTLVLPQRPALPTFPAVTFVRSIMASNSGVMSMAFTPDGKMLLTASHDGTLKVWDASTGASLRALPGHKGDVVAVRVTADGRYAVSAGEHTIRIWSLPDGMPVRAIDGAIPRVYAMALSPNGRTIVAGGENGTAKVWTFDGAPVATLTLGTRGRVLSVAFSPDGSRVITAGDDKLIRAWTTSDWKLQRVFAGHKAAVGQAIVAPDGQTLVSASDDRTVRLWHLETTRLLETLSLHTDEAWSVAVSPDGGTLMTGGKDARLGVWSLPRGRLEQEVPLDEKTLTPSIAFSPDGITVASGHVGVVYLWRLARGTAHAALPALKIASAVMPRTATQEQRTYAEAMDLVDSYAGEAETLDRADTRLQAMLRANPRSALAYAGLGRVAFNRGMRTSDDYDPAALKMAREMSEKAIAIDPALPDAYCVRGSAELEAKDVASARADAKTAVKLAPNMPRAVLLWANMEVSDGDLDGAEKTLRDLLSRPIAPAMALAGLEGLSDVYEKLGDYKAADQARRRQLEVAPDQAWTKGDYAAFLMREGDYDAAIVMAKRALVQMDYGAARHVLAKAHCAKGEQDLWDHNDAGAALEGFEAAASVSPTFERAAYDLGAYHQYLARTRDERELATARTFYAKAVMLDPKDAAAKKALAALRGR
jgi:tetratricopeptide (TPR) repeat protein